MYGQLMKLKAAHRGAYIGRFDSDSIYNSNLTIVEERTGNLGDRTADVVYFEELPDVVHLAKHFEPVNNETIQNFEESRSSNTDEREEPQDRGITF